MKKLLFVFVFISFVFISCDNGSDENVDELKKENQELRDALAANSKITNVEFMGNEMILTYSNGLKLTTSVPEVLKGEDGETPKIGENGNWWIGDTDSGVAAQGASPFIGDNGNWWIGDTDTEVAASGADGVDGVGIQSIIFDQATSIMTITLTNGEESKFVIDNKDGLSAYIMEDLNGKYLVKRITMGDIPYAEFEYNSDNQISKIISYTADGYQLLKSFEIEKEYTESKVSKIIRRDFATEQVVKYSDEYLGNISGHELVQFDENKGYQFIEENSDGSFYYYARGVESDGKYNYNRYFANKNSRLDNEIVSNEDGTYMVYKYYLNYQVYNNTSGETDTYYSYNVFNDCLVSDEYSDQKSLKIADGVFKIYNNNDSSSDFNISGELVSKYFLKYYLTRTLTGIYGIGDPIKESYSTIEYSVNNQIDKTYENREEGTDATTYIQNYYDGDNLAKTERYNKQDGNWVKDARYQTYSYTSEGLLYETIDHDAEGNKTVVAKIEYDSEGNPIEIFKYSGDIIYSDFFDRYYNMIDPETGLQVDGDDVYKEAGLYSYAKLEYNYTMKNFFGNTFAGLFPELYGYSFSNAIKSASISNSFVAGAIEYIDFNDGGYPQTMKFIGNSDYELEGYVGLLKIEYQKIEE